MAVTETSLVLKAAPLPPGFSGSPQEFFEAIVARMKIVSPFGFTSFVIGGAEPTSNQGPWLKDGKQWWVWSETEAKYVPEDLSHAAIPAFWFQEATPSSGTPNLWFKASSTKFFGVYVFINGKWVPITITSGPTTARPSTPFDFQEFYDTDIQARIWWERGAWRTIDGVTGDIKYVTFTTSDEALRKNPGWEILGTGDSSNIAWRGRVISQATKDADGSPNARNLGLEQGITARQPGNTFGQETHTLIIEEIPAHSHIIDGNPLSNDNEDLPPKVTIEDDYLNGNPLTKNTRSAGGGNAHNNLQPTVAFWCLRKT